MRTRICAYSRARRMHAHKHANEREGDYRSAQQGYIKPLRLANTQTDTALSNPTGK